MKSLENILNVIENLQFKISVLIEEVDQLQKLNFKNIIFNNEKQINKLLFKIYELQGRVDALMWTIGK